VIRAVTLDFWETAYTEGPARDRRRALRREYAKGFFLGMGVRVTERQVAYAFEILWHDIEHYRVARQVSFGAEEIGRRLGRVVGVQLDAEQAVRLGELISSAGREEPPVPAEGTRQLLEALHGRVKLGLISDTGITLGHDLYAVMEADGLTRYFDHFTFSNQTGTTKPMARQFLHTVHRLGCPPEQAVHVGDLEPTDIVGAKRAGMRAIRIVHPGQDPTTQADAVVECMAQVVDILSRWGVEM